MININYFNTLYTDVKLQWLIMIAIALYKRCINVYV